MDLLQLYFDALAWMALHPFQFFIILWVEFTVLYWIYYKSRENKYLKIIFGTFFQPQNLVFNCTVMTIVGLELPKETATTKRCKRWLELEPTSRLKKWRRKVAAFLCGLMNKADPGHCGSYN